MKCYLLKEEDFNHLLALIDRDPRHGHSGGSSAVFDKEETEAQKEAHGFYNYQVRTWVREIKDRK